MEIDNKLNEIKHSAQLVLSAQSLAYSSMPLELAETKPRSNFPESRNAFSKVRSAKLNTDVKILMPGTDYFGETALKQDIIYLSTPCGNHTITHFRCTGSGLDSNLNRQQNHTFFADRQTTGLRMESIPTCQHKRRRYVIFQPNISLYFQKKPRELDLS